MKNVLAEVEKQPFKDQNRTGAAEDGEWLASQQTENPTGNRCAQKTLQHTLRTQLDNSYYEHECKTLCKLLEGSNLSLTCMFSVASPNRPPKVMAFVTVPR